MVDAAIHEMETRVSYLTDKSKGEEEVNAVPVELVVAAIQVLHEDLVLDPRDLLEDGSEESQEDFFGIGCQMRKKWLMR